jgi:prepilin-type N-terminal cleavage/methylation domain-containing protein
MKTSTHFQPARGRQHGIGLFEMLLVISILGIMAALALPSFGQQRDVFAEVKNKRNAQEIVAEFTIAQAAGVSIFAGATVEEILARLVEGVVMSEGPFIGRKFGLKNLSSEEVQGAAKHLKLASGQLSLR